MSTGQPPSTVFPELSLIIPAFNEADHLFDSVQVVLNEVQLSARGFELILVDDGSRDETWHEIQRLTLVYPHVRGIRLSRNFGKESALAAGLDHSCGKAILILDADLQHPPSLIPQFIGVWRTGEADIVEGVKRARNDEPVVRRSVSRIFNWSATKLTGIALMHSSDFKLLDRRVVEAWRLLQERRCFFRGIVAWLGFRRAVIEFDVDPRVKGKSKFSVIALIRLAWWAISSFSALPLRVIHLASVAYLVFGSLLAARAFYLYFNGQAVGGATTAILLILISVGLVLGSLAIVAEYLAAIYDEVKNRPRYIVAEQI